MPFYLLRDAFLSAYVGDNDCACDDVSEDLTIEEYLSGYQKSSTSSITSDEGCLSAAIRCGPLLLEKLMCRKLCATLPLNGKGVVSRYQLNACWLQVASSMMAMLTVTHHRRSHSCLSPSSSSDAWPCHITMK